MRARTIGTAVLAVLFTLAYLTGTLYNALVASIVFGPIVGTVRHVRLRRADALAPTPREVWRQQDLRAAGRIAVRVVLWVLVAGLVLLALPISQLDGGELLRWRGQTILAALVMAGFAFRPPAEVSRRTEVALALAVAFLALQAVRVQLPLQDDAAALHLPLQGEWIVGNGGASTIVNHHYGIRSQRHALDLVQAADGRTFTDEDDATTYLAWGAPVLAPIAGTVVVAVGDLPDVPIGESDRDNLAGNHVVLDAGDGRFVLLAHLREGSLQVAVGEMVEVGERLAELGNSGNTSEPHLHLQVQDAAAFEDVEQTFPIRFVDAEVTRLGGTVEDVRLRRNDRLAHRPATSDDGTA